MLISAKRDMQPLFSAHGAPFKQKGLAIKVCSGCHKIGALALKKAKEMFPDCPEYTYVSAASKSHPAITISTILRSGVTSVVCDFICT